ncbi:MAG: SirB2 family protein [Bdellovibrionales bacterium]|nr:SirB2 family protein [Bdellovibrionales bacterium]
MYSAFHITHLVFVLLFTGATFTAFANPAPERKRKTLLAAHISGFLVFLTGFGLLGVLKWGVPGWAIVKLVCWLAMSAFSGIAFRKRDASSLFIALTVAALTIAVVMVDLKPF